MCFYPFSPTPHFAFCMWHRAGVWEILIIDTPVRIVRWTYRSCHISRKLKWTINSAAQFCIVCLPQGGTHKNIYMLLYSYFIFWVPQKFLPRGIRFHSQCSQLICLFFLSLLRQFISLFLMKAASSNALAAVYSQIPHKTHFYLINKFTFWKFIKFLVHCRAARVSEISPVCPLQFR